MKNIKAYFLFALLMAGGFMQAQETKEYYPLIPKSGEKQWDTRRDFIWGESDYMINWLGDEIELDGVMYRKMHYTLDGSGYYFTGLEGAFREEDKKVYVRGWNSGFQHFNEEILYYDGGGGEENETWIEGIGSLAGVSHRFDPNIVGSFFSHLQCYFEDDNLVWTDGECWDGVEETVEEQVGVYPNPASDIVRVEGITVAEVQVYNSIGQLVKTVYDSNEINVAGLPEGVCQLRITDAEGRSHVVRVAVKE